MGVTATQLLFAQSEKVLPKLQDWMGQWKTPANLIPKRNVETISERDFRIPAKLTAGGRAGTFDPNAGEIGRGNGMTGTYGISTFYPLRMAMELSLLAQEATKSREQAVKSAFSEAMKDIMKEMVLFHNRTFFSDGTSKMGQAKAHAVVSGKSVYTLDPVFSYNKLRRGQYLTVYASDSTTVRDAATKYIEAIDWAGGKIRLSGTVSGAAADDQFHFEGVSGANPTGPNGLYYFNSDAETGTTLGIDRAVEPEVRANSSSASGGLSQLTALHLLHQILDRCGDEMTTNLLGVASTNAHAIAMQQVMAIQRIDIGGMDAQMKDLLPSVDWKFKYGGVTHWVQTAAAKDRIDWFSPNSWGVARLHDLKFFEIGGNRFFPLYGAGGSPSAAMWFALILQENWFCMNPRQNGYIKSVPLGSLYGG